MVALVRWPPPALLPSSGLGGYLRQCRPALLRPWAPTLLMHADVSNGFKVVPKRYHPGDLRVDHPSVCARMAWVLSYPSATAAWYSVYSNALKGRFDMSLPNAIANTSLRAKLVDGKLYVTRMQVLEMTPTEEPFEFAAADAPRKFLFNETLHLRPVHGTAAAPASDPTIAVNGQVAPMTDEQWATVEPLLLAFLGRGGPRTHAVRDLIECARLKLGTPYSWSKCPGNKSLVQSASVLLSKLQRGGVWNVCQNACREFLAEFPTLAGP